MRWRIVTVRLDGSLGDEGPGPFVPPFESKHDYLLDQLMGRDDQWAVQALVACLEGVGEDAGSERIAVTDAWTEDPDTLCLIYTPPYSSGLAGVRRQRGDRDPLHQLTPRPVRGEPDEFATSNDPQAFGLAVLDDISEPLGAFHNRLRYDYDGLGWWGTLDDVLPRPPSP